MAIYDLPQQVHDVVTGRAGLPADTYLTWVPRLQGIFFNFNFERGFGELNGAIDKEMISLVRICGHQLQQTMPPGLRAEELDALRKAVDDAINAATRADLPEHLREYVLRLLMQVYDAVTDYWLQGVDALGRALVMAVGSSRVHAETFSEAARSVVGDTFVRALVMLWKTLSAVGNICQLGEWGQLLLEGPTQSIVNGVSAAAGTGSVPPAI